MAYVTYTAKREIEKTGYSKTGTDLSAIDSDDSIDAATTDLSGLSTDQWLQAAGFVKNAGWFQVKSNSTSAKILTLTPPVNHLRLPGVTGNYASTPDSVSVSLTTDMDFRVKLSLIDWTPATVQSLLSKTSGGAGQLSYHVFLGTDGKLNLLVSSDGTAQNVGTSSVATGLVDGSTKWVRATRVSSSGLTKFFLSDDGVSWTQLGTDVSTGSGVTFDSTSEVRIGQSFTASPIPATGRVYYAEIRSSVDGTVVAAFDPTRGTRGVGSFVSATTETWTINSSGTPPALLQGPRIFDEGAEYLSLPGVAGNYASTPDSAANSVTGDLELIVRASLTDWTPAAIATLIAKWNTTGNQRSYALSVNTDGTLNLSWSADGTAVLSKNSTVATGFADGAIAWVRATLDVNNGAAGNDVKFYTSTDGVTWVQLGTTVTTAATTAVFNSTAVLEVGSMITGTSQLAIGRVYYASLLNGLAGPVAAVFDPGRAAAGASSLIAYTGETWTINTSGSPAAALVRTTPVTLTGYKRGLGQSYNIEFKAEQVDRAVKVKRSEQQPLDTSKPPETLLFGQHATISVLSEVFSEASQIQQFREFLASVSAGEIFTFDRYGTVASPVDPRQAQLESADYAEQRVMRTLQQRIPFTVRLLS